jgi:putative membrane protein
MKPAYRSKTEIILMLAITGTVLAWSAIGPEDRLTWWLEVAPVLIGLSILVPTYRRVPLTGLLYWLIVIHAIILMVRGHYTYAKVPAGFCVQDALDLARNHYDRLGHFAQGFIPAILAREILLRTSPLRPDKWLFVIVACICLAFSAFYEMIEWWAAVISGGAATDFLGTQGDVWDTQWDMFIALVGAMTAQILLGRVHDRALVAQ